MSTLAPFDEDETDTLYVYLFFDVGDRVNE